MSTRIFINYSFQDREVAEKIMNQLNSAGLDVTIDNYYKDNLFMNINSLYNMKPGDYMIILISQETKNNKWYKFDLENYLEKNISNRNITFVPVYLSRVNKVINGGNIVSFNLYNNFDNGLKKIIDFFIHTKYLDFDNIDPFQFEEMSKKLLSKMKLRIIDNFGSQDLGYDFLAESTSKDPFGVKVVAKWAVECKYSKQNRADIKTLKQLEQLLETRLPDFNGVLITNGLLTSASYELLTTLKKREKIRIVDGIQLKTFLLKYPSVINEFFGGGIE
jgi:HJR/Mrr/RecB family endonuclease